MRQLAARPRTDRGASRIPHAIRLPVKIGVGILIAGIIILAASTFMVYNNWRRLQNNAAAPAISTVISQKDLQEKYGMRIQLVAITAAGGLVDLRVQILDPQKARLLLRSQADFPVLLIRDRGIRMLPSEESQAQVDRLETLNVVFALYSNTGNAVKSATPVTIMFGDTAVEAIPAQ